MKEGTSAKINDNKNSTIQEGHFNGILSTPKRQLKDV